MDALDTEPNVRLIGPRGIREPPAFVRAFDVALVPYVRTAYTDTVYPTKLLEYLTMGCPVVATDLPEVRDLRLPEFAVRIAGDGDGCIAAVRAALQDRERQATERRRALARERDWGSVVSRMAALIAEQLAVRG